MDPTLYRAAMDGQVDFLRQHKDQLGIQLTVNKGTILHVAAQFHDNIECVQVILNLQPSLICRVNSKLETALHIAARKGHSNTVRVLIQHSKSLEESQMRFCESYLSWLCQRVQNRKEMIWMTNKHKDTALHEAVRNNHPDVVKMLLREDAVFPHPPNKFEETPLYIAAKEDYHEIVSTILEACKSPSHSGPDGRTALHAAVMAGCSACTNKILEKMPNLVRREDFNGWTPLHHAAHLNIVPCALQLLKADESTCAIQHLKADKSAVYHKNDDDQTPLHIAASQGYTDIMRELLSHYPDCWEIVNGEGHNILHIAMERKKEEIRIVKNSWLSNLENQMDTDENTHFNLRPVSNKASTSITEGNWPTDQDEIKGTPEVVDADDHQSYRRTHETGMKKGKAEDTEMGLEDFNNIRNSHMIVAALIATVTFTAGLTVPGGYKGSEGPDQGRAVLVRAAAFKAFVIANALAMVLSFYAIAVHLVSPLTKVQRELEKHFAFAIYLTAFASLAMMIAFISGSYAVLANSSGLAVGVLITGSSYFLIDQISGLIECQGAKSTLLEWFYGRKIKREGKEAGWFQYAQLAGKRRGRVLQRRWGRK